MQSSSGMTLFMLRDDDANATTDPALLARTWSPLLDAGIPVSFSVIPSVALDTRAPDGDRERFIDPAAPDGPTCVDLTAETPLAVWLRQHRGEVAVLQHGMTHTRLRAGTEFGAIDEATALDRIDRGGAVLRAALGEAPDGFVAPWDAFSRGAVSAAVARFPLVSIGWLGRDRLPPRQWLRHVVERVRKCETLRLDGSVVVRHRGGRIHDGTQPHEIPAILDALSRRAEVAVVVLHYWMVPPRGGEPHPAVVALARALRGRSVVTPKQCVARLAA